MRIKCASCPSETATRPTVSDHERLTFFQANEDVTQIVKVLPPGPAKWTWLTGRLVQLTTGQFRPVPALRPRTRGHHVYTGSVPSHVVSRLHAGNARARDHCVHTGSVPSHLVPCPAQNWAGTLCVRLECEPEWSEVRTSTLRAFCLQCLLGDVRCGLNALCLFQREACSSS